MIHASYVWSCGFNLNNSYYVHSPAEVYGPTDFKRTHAFVLQHIYDFPFGKGQRSGNNTPKWANYLIGGWEWTGVTTWESGQSLTPSYQTSGATEDVGVCIPDRMGNVIPAHQTQNQWFITVPRVLSPGQVSSPWGAPRCRNSG